MTQPYPIEILVHARQGDDSHRGLQPVAADLHGRARASRGSRSHVQRPLDRPLGRRHARRRHRRLYDRHVARRRRNAAQRQDAHRRALSPRGAGSARGRNDDHGSRGAHETVDAHERVCPPPRLDARRVRLPAEQPQLHHRRRQVRHQSRASRCSNDQDDDGSKRRARRALRHVAMVLGSVIGILALAAWTSRAEAHHSFSVFDMTTNKELEGEVVEFQWTNPHTLHLDQRHERRRHRRRVGVSKA